jgi:hypothetical protein
VVHPASLGDLREQADARAAPRLVASAPSPHKRVPLLVPVSRRIFDRLSDLPPGREASPFAGERAENFPPRFNQDQARRGLGREDELPARVGERDQEHIHGPMDVEVGADGVDGLNLGRDPVVHRSQEIHPVGDGAPRVLFGEGRPIARLERAIEGAFPMPPLIDLRERALGRAEPGRVGERPHPLLAGETLGRFRPPLIHADGHTLWRQNGMELGDRPLV